MEKLKPQNLKMKLIIDELKILSESKAPLIIKKQDYLSIEVDQKLKSKAKAWKYTVEEKDAIELLPKEKEPLQTEFVDELYI